MSTYSLAAATGVFGVGSYAPNKLAYNRKLSGATGSFVVTGRAIVVVRALAIVALTGMFVETAESLAFKHIYKATGPPTGVFALTGSAAVLQKTPTLTAYNASFSCAGFATLAYNRHLAGATGVFAKTAHAATILVPKLFPVSTGVFAEVGSAAVVKWNHQLVGADGVFAAAGHAEMLAIGAPAIPLATGTFVETGAAAEVAYNRKLIAATGVFSLADSFDLELEYSGAVVQKPGATWTTDLCVDTRWIAAVEIELIPLIEPPTNGMICETGIFMVTPNFAAMWPLPMLNISGSFALTGSWADLEVR
jgi:hypothetical protein